MWNMCKRTFWWNSSNDYFISNRINEWRINQIRILLDEINNNIEHIQKIKENILSFYKNLKEIKENSFIYKSNDNNNFKFVFINYLNI